MQPRLPRSGRLPRQFPTQVLPGQPQPASISSPSKTARGPVRQLPLQAALGTQGSLDAPRAVDADGTAQGGGSTGSGKAGVGHAKSGLRKQLPKLLRHDPLPRQPRQPQPSPPEPGNARPVVVGNGENRQDPVGSIAGNRNLVQPDETATNNAIAVTATHNINCGSGAVVDRWVVVFIVPSIKTRSRSQACGQRLLGEWGSVAELAKIFGVFPCGITESLGDFRYKWSEQILTTER